MYKTIFGRIYSMNLSTFSVRNKPVTILELTQEGLNQDIAQRYIELTEALYTAYVGDVLFGKDVSADTISIWRKLLEFCRSLNLTDREDEDFPFYDFDIVLRHKDLLLQREIWRFRLVLEEILSGVDLAECKIENEYGIIFQETKDGGELQRWSAFHTDPQKRHLQKLSVLELRSILARVRSHWSRNEKMIQPQEIDRKIRAVAGNAVEIQTILERTHQLVDEQLALETLEEKLTTVIEQPYVHNLTNRDVLYILLKEDVCAKEHHHCTEIQAQLEFYNGTKKQLSVRRCANCQQYQMTYEAFEKMRREYGIPKTVVVYCGEEERLGTAYWDVRSVFSEHGYSVSQEVGLSMAERQRKLRWIIENGYVSKQDAIRYLQRRIDINGKKSENWLAKSKWEEDLRYIRSL